MNELVATILITQDKLAALVKQLKVLIAELPDNPKISRIPGTAAFVVNSSALSECWQPEYHDFKTQYRLILQAVGDTVYHDSIAIARLRSILAAGWVGCNKLHPDVIKHIRGLLT